MVLYLLILLLLLLLTKVISILLNLIFLSFFLFYSLLSFLLSFLLLLFLSFLYLYFFFSFFFTSFLFFPPFSFLFGISYSSFLFLLLLLDRIMVITRDCKSLKCRFNSYSILFRIVGIEPTFLIWKINILPLNYTLFWFFYLRSTPFSGNLLFPRGSFFLPLKDFLIFNETFLFLSYCSK